MEPQHQQPAGAKNFFLYFLAFALLYTVAFNFGGLLFDFINKTIPLVGGSGGTFSASLLRFHLASLIIGTPVFLWLSKMVYTHSLKDSVVRNSGIRRWLTYITMILTALIVIGDLIALVNNLLSGETTMRFILKALVVLVIAGSIFYYYLTDIKDMKANTDAKSVLPKIYFITASTLILVSIISGFFFIESPMQQRLRNEDQARLNNLQNVDSAIYNYAQTTNGKLPADLSAIQGMTIMGATLDPVTQQPFTYTVTSTTTYELCGTFSTSNRDAASEYYAGPDWAHDQGNACFKRSLVNQIDQYPPDKTAPLTAPAPVAPAP